LESVAGGAAAGAVIGAVQGVLASALEVIRSMAEYAYRLLTRLAEWARRALMYYVDLWGKRPFDALALTLIIAYWLSPL